MKELNRKAYQLERFIYANEGVGVSVEIKELELLNRDIEKLEAVN